MEKTTLDHFISALLYEHDCVIIADLGGFVANYKSSYLHPTQHTLSPPSKKIAFNSSLKINDGLLASYISENQAVSYHQACQIISEYVEEAFNVLESGRKLRLQDIGSLYFNAEKKIQFSPETNINYLLDSFGLTNLHSTGIKKDVPSRKVEIKLPQQPEIFEQQSKIKKRFSLRWLELIPAAAVLTLLFLNPPVIKNINKNLGGLLPEFNLSLPAHDMVVSQQTVSNLPDQHAGLVMDTSSPSDNSLFNDSSENNNNTNGSSVPVTKGSLTDSATHADFVNPVNPESKPVTASVKETKMPAVTPIDEVAIPGRYYLIAGCFKIEDNAKSLYNELLSKGYPAQLIGKYKGLHVVACQSEASAIAARDAVALLSDKGVETWVLKK
jgi:hypothetical protein